MQLCNRLSVACLLVQKRKNDLPILRIIRELLVVPPVIFNSPRNQITHSEHDKRDAAQTEVTKYSVPEPLHKLSKIIRTCNEFEQTSTRYLVAFSFVFQADQMVISV